MKLVFEDFQKNYNYLNEDNIPVFSKNNSKQNFYNESKKKQLPEQNTRLQFTNDFIIPKMNEETFYKQIQFPVHTKHYEPEKTTYNPYSFTNSQSSEKEIFELKKKISEMENDINEKDKKIVKLTNKVVNYKKTFKELYKLSGINEKINIDISDLDAVDIIDILKKYFNKENNMKKEKGEISDKKTKKEDRTLKQYDIRSLLHKTNALKSSLQNDEIKSCVRDEYSDLPELIPADEHIGDLRENKKNNEDLKDVLKKTQLLKKMFMNSRTINDDFMEIKEFPYNS